MYPIRTKFLTNSKNRAYQWRTEPLRHVVIHETVSMADAQTHYQSFNDPTHDYRANATGFIDWKEILIVLPLEEKALHVGEPANNFTIGFELCRATTATEFNREWKIAVWYIAKLCHDYERHDVDEFVLSHDEIRRRYGGTDHTDPNEYFVMYGKTMDQFRSAVKEELAKMQTGYQLSEEDAVKITGILGKFWHLLNEMPGTNEAKSELARLADEVRLAAGLPTQNR